MITNTSKEISNEVLNLMKIKGEERGVSHEKMEGLIKSSMASFTFSTIPLDKGVPNYDYIQYMAEVFLEWTEDELSPMGDSLEIIMASIASISTDGISI